MKKVIATLLYVLLCAAMAVGCSQSKAVENNRPADDYDWDYIASLLQADEASPEEVDELTRLYGVMTPKDMERFLAAGYVSQPHEEWRNREWPSYVLSNVMVRVCERFSEQTDMLVLTHFNDEGKPNPDVTPQQTEAAQQQMLRADIMRDVCNYGREVYSAEYSTNTEVCAPVSITQFGPNGDLLGDLYTYNIVLRHYAPFTTMYDSVPEWASRGMGTGMITARQANGICRDRTVKLRKGWADLEHSPLGFPRDIADAIAGYRQGMDKKSFTVANRAALDAFDGLEVLSASVRVGYNATAMQTEVRYVTYDESEAYIRYQAYIDQLPQGEYRPSVMEFVEALQSGGGESEPEQYKLFDRVTEWYATNPTVEFNELRTAYDDALEDARIARPDIEWPATLNDCTQEQMIILESYL